MPLSGIGLWDAEITTPRSAPERLGEVGDAGRRQDAQPEHVDPGRRQPGDDRMLEELSRDPGVTADHRHRALPVVPAVVDQDPRGGDPEVDRELGGDDTVGEPADAVRPEDARHRAVVSAC